MKCPKCQSRMETINHGEITVGRCTRCGGLWLEALDAERLRDTPGAEAIDQMQSTWRPPIETADRIDCPRCHGPMIQMTVHRQPHIRYEGCTVCHGVFFDAGEFSDMKRFTLAERLAAIVPGVSRLRLG